MFSDLTERRMHGADHERQAHLARQFLGGLHRFRLAAEDIDRVDPKSVLIERGHRVGVAFRVGHVEFDLAGCGGRGWRSCFMIPQPERR